MSSHGKNHNLDLGPFRPKFERMIFENEPIETQGIISRANVVDARGGWVELGIAPYRVKLLYWNVWHFMIGGFDFYIKADQRPFPKSWEPFLINNNTDLTLPKTDPVRIHELPKFQPIFEQMMKRRTKPPKLRI